MRDKRGRFLPGPDKDRHAFSRFERQKGYRVATQERKMPSRLRSWLWKRIKGYYAGKPRRRASA